jgi:hypothetical protein
MFLHSIIPTREKSMLHVSNSKAGLSKRQTQPIKIFCPIFSLTDLNVFAMNCSSIVISERFKPASGLGRDTLEATA